MLKRTFFAAFLLVLTIGLFFTGRTTAQGTPHAAEFTYQGSIKDAGVPVNGNYEMRFEYYSELTGGFFLGSSTTNVTVVNGIFTATLGADALFALWQPGSSLWIETLIRPSSASPYITLSPRQKINSAPFAVSSLLSADSQRLGGVAANQFVTTASGGTTFIQNGTTLQSGSFSLDGTGSANAFNAASQFSIGGNRILSAPGGDNLFAGFLAGQNNSTGAANAFFGVAAGGANTTGNNNAFFGRTAGTSNSVGNANSFFGSSAGVNNSSGNSNSFFGVDAGSSNFVGSFNTMIGAGANVTANNLTNATALGARAAVSSSNSLVLGGINGINGASANTNVGIGLTNPTQRLHIADNGANIVFGGLGCGPGVVGINFFSAVQSNSCVNYSILGDGANTYLNRSSGGSLVFRMANNDQMSLVPAGDLGIGTSSPTSRLHVVTNSNSGLRVQTNAAGGSVASFGGLGDFSVDRSGVPGGRFMVRENGNFGFGTTATTRGFFNIQAPGGNTNIYMAAGGATNGINLGVVGTSADSVLYVSQYDGTTYKDRLIVDQTGKVNVPANFQAGSISTGPISAGSIDSLGKGRFRQGIFVDSQNSSGVLFGGRIGIRSDNVARCFALYFPESAILTSFEYSCSSEGSPGGPTDPLPGTPVRQYDVQGTQDKVHRLENEIKELRQTQSLLEKRLLELEKALAKPQ
jgi:hypothetical protein